ncbi:C-C motif chemokine 32b.3 [Clupea harengus]|uniref:C-C motif chemokine 32b.3 n=1 Tax=Clupea harengus TaxID=7950 RepID=A0A6P8GLR7_CLUHA|nr:C-C motif chemokine 32b.3 [Clupea harengus]
MNISTLSVCCLISSCFIISAVSSPTADCCLSLSVSRPRIKNVKDYHIQPQGGLCPIDAVVLLTKSGKRICANPDSPWVKDAMKKVNEERVGPPVTQQDPPRRRKGKGKGRGRGKGRRERGSRAGRQ